MQKFLFILVLAFFISGCPGGAGTGVDEIIGPTTVVDDVVVDDDAVVEPIVVVALPDLAQIVIHCEAQVEAPDPEDDNRFLCTSGTDQYFREIEERCSSAKGDITCVDGTVNLTEFTNSCVANHGSGSGGVVKCK